MSIPGLLGALEGLMLSMGGLAQRRASELKAAYVAGDLDKETFTQLLAAVLVGINGQGIMAGRAALVDYLGLPAEVQTVSDALVSGVAAADAGLSVRVQMSVERHYLDAGRLERAITTVLEDDAVASDRLERLAHSEPIEATQQGFQSAMTDAPEVNGWKRGLDGDPCQLCQWWYRGGRVWPLHHRMPTHKGCACVPVPVVSSESIKPTERQRKKRKTIT